MQKSKWLKYTASALLFSIFSLFFCLSVFSQIVQEYKKAIEQGQKVLFRKQSDNVAWFSKNGNL